MSHSRGFIRILSDPLGFLRLFRMFPEFLEFFGILLDFFVLSRFVLYSFRSSRILSESLGFFRIRHDSLKISPILLDFFVFSSIFSHSSRFIRILSDPLGFLRLFQSFWSLSDYIPSYCSIFFQIVPDFLRFFWIFWYSLIFFRILSVSLGFS